MKNEGIKSTVSKVYAIARSITKSELGTAVYYNKINMLIALAQDAFYNKNDYEWNAAYNILFRLYSLKIISVHNSFAEIWPFENIGENDFTFPELECLKRPSDKQITGPSVVHRTNPDIMSAIMLAFKNAVIKFNFNKGSNFTSYVSTVMCNSLKRLYSTEYKTYINECLSLNASMGTENEDSEEYIDNIPSLSPPIDTGLIFEDMYSEFNILISKASKYGISIMNLKRNGFTSQEAANILGVSKSTVDRAIALAHSIYETVTLGSTIGERQAALSAYDKQNREEMPLLKN